MVHFFKFIMVGKIKLAYMASGSGSSVEALHHKIDTGALQGFESSLILCNKHSDEAGIYERAERLNIPIFYAASGLEQLAVLKKNKIDLILGLGYISKVEDVVLNEYHDRVLNIHPTLLPKHGGKGMYGLATHRSVLAAIENFTGPTVHLMNSKFDEGRILDQLAMDVPEHLIGQPSEENAKELQRYVLDGEYFLMADVLKQISEGSIKVGKF